MRITRPVNLHTQRTLNWMAFEHIVNRDKSDDCPVLGVTWGWKPDLADTVPILDDSVDGALRKSTKLLCLTYINLAHATKAEFWTISGVLGAAMLPQLRAIVTARDKQVSGVPSEDRTSMTCLIRVNEILCSRLSTSWELTTFNLRGSRGRSDTLSPETSPYSTYLSTM